MVGSPLSRFGVVAGDSPAAFDFGLSLSRPARSPLSNSRSKAWTEPALSEVERSVRPTLGHVRINRRNFALIQATMYKE